MRGGDKNRIKDLGIKYKGKEGKMKKVIGVLAVVIFVVSVMSIGSAKAFEQITAQKAYEMVAAGEATLIDVRTTAEFLWVGTCKLPDGTTPYNIPWKIWAYQFSGDEKVKAGGIVVKRLFGRLVQKTFPDKTKPLILMCRSGHRSSAGADYLESLGYTTVYEIDNALKEEADAAKPVGKRGGRGGFQGSGYKGAYNGYRGYPGRNPKGMAPGTVTADLLDKDQSVSWSDTGLPMTQSVDKDKIWMYMWK